MPPARLSLMKKTRRERPAAAAGAVLGGCLLLLAGCAPLPSVHPAPPPAPAPAPEPPPPPPPPPVVAAEPAPSPAVPHVEAVAQRLFAFNDYLRQLPPGELAQEVQRLNVAASATPSAVNFLEFALALGLTRSNGDLARAMGLIEPLLRSTAPDVLPWQPFARFIQVRYAEQRRLEEALDRQIKEQRDTRNRLDQANEKLEALKAIERSLTPRLAPLPSSSSSKGP